MAGQGCPHEGPDHRLLGRIGCWVQSRLSFHSQTPPKERKAETENGSTLSVRWPPYVGVAIKLPGIETRWLSFRAGFRWDPYWPYPDNTGRKGGYIFPEVILKVTKHKLY